MSRSIRVFAGFVLMVLVVGVSFAGGQYLRSRAGSSGPLGAQLSAMLASRRPVSLPASQGGVVLADPRDLFLQVQQHVEQYCVDPMTNEQRMGSGAVRSMLASLDDPKTRYYDPKQRAAFEGQLNGTFEGIGATLQVVRRKKGDIEERRLVVEAPVTGGPAAKAGVRAGDSITEINGAWVIAYDPQLDLDRVRVRNMTDDQYRKAELEVQKRLAEGISLPRALDTLTLGSGKAVKLTIERPGAATPIHVTLTTAVTNVDPVQFRDVDANTALLHVTEFNDQATRDLTSDLKSSTQHNLIVDLRDNPGGPITNASSGVLGCAVALMQQIAPGGPVVTLVHKGDKRDVIHTPAAKVPPRRIMVLVDQGTANVAEAVAAALRDRGATIIGTRTFGDGTLQRYYPLVNGGGMTLNAGRLMAPRDVEIAGVGVKPDVTLEASGTSTQDVALDRAMALLSRSERSER